MRLAAAGLPAFLCIMLGAGCARPPATELTIDQVLPAGAVKAEIIPEIGENHTELSGNYFWCQGFKTEDSLEQVLQKLSATLEPHGYRLEDHRNYRDTLGDTGVRNADVLRIFRGPGRSIGVFYFRPITKYYKPEYADFSVMLRNY